MRELCKIGAVKGYGDIEGLTPKAIVKFEKQKMVVRFFRKGPVDKKRHLWLRRLGLVVGCRGGRCAVIMFSVFAVVAVVIFRRHACRSV